jgi:hypothetical protein
MSFIKRLLHGSARGLRFLARLAVAVAIVVVVALVLHSAWGGHGQKPKLVVSGEPCAAVAGGGSLFVSGTGFTPNGEVFVLTPKHGDTVRADGYGRIRLLWPCKGQPPKVAMIATDVPTNKSVQTALIIDRYIK